MRCAQKRQHIVYMSQKYNAPTSMPTAGGVHGTVGVRGIQLYLLMLQSDCLYTVYPHHEHIAADMEDFDYTYTDAARGTVFMCLPENDLLTAMAEHGNTSCTRGARTPAEAEQQLHRVCGTALRGCACSGAASYARESIQTHVGHSGLPI